MTKPMKRKGPKMPKAPELPVNSADSNAKGDRISVAVFIFLLLASAVTLGGGVYSSTTSFLAAINSSPVNWVGIIFATLFLTATILIARSLLWFSFFGTVMLSSKLGAWKVAEEICRRSIKLPQAISRGSSWAAVALVQSLVNRGQFRTAIEAADDEWQRSGEDKRQVQNLGPMCVAVGIAAQVEEDMKDSLKWNERAIQCLTQSLEELSKPKTGMLAKAMSPQSNEWLAQVKTQLAVAHFNIATIYVNKMDYRRAKENFKKSVDYASQAPDFPQKSDILKLSREQLARLKHA